MRRKKELSPEQQHEQRDTIQSLGGPTALAKLTGINKRTIDALQQGENRWSAPTRLLFKILQVLNSAGWLEDIINKVQQIEKDNDK